MLDNLKVIVGESAEAEIKRLAGQMTPKQQGILVRWLETLTAEKLLDDGVALKGKKLEGVYQVKNNKFTLRFIVRNNSPQVIQLIVEGMIGVS